MVFVFYLVAEQLNGGFPRRRVDKAPTIVAL